MYNNRYFLKSGHIIMSIDAKNGAILSIVNEENGDNLIKNSMFDLPNPFYLTSGDITFSALKSHEINYKYKPEIIAEENQITVFYPRMTHADKTYKIAVFIKIIANGDASFGFSMHVENLSGLKIDDCRFPCINGIYFGDSYENDTLVYPYNAGIKINNPIEYLETKPKKIQWKWQDYCYNYNVDGICGYTDKLGLYTLNYMYSGPQSMPWTDYYSNSDNCGLYFGIHDTDNAVSQIGGVCVSSGGAKLPGMCFSVYRKIESSDDFGIENVVFALHDGDWHSGADIYKKYRYGNKISAIQRKKKKKSDWFTVSSGLSAHYDFKYQNGDIIHKFDAIPRLADEALAQGLDHLLISGWHTDGFDNGFPCYEPDAALGGVKALATAIEKATDSGVFISFYINTRLMNKKYAVEQYAQISDSCAARKVDGGLYTEKYGDRSLEFINMCPNTPEWRNIIVDAAKFLASIGADGVYYDQLAMAPSLMCHDKRHGHDIAEWNGGYVELLSETKKIKRKRGGHLNIMVEGCSDIYDGYVDGYLVSTFAYEFSGAFPELYKYANPHHVVIDMVYPSKNNFMRPEHIAKRSTSMINRAFVNGTYLWVYDLEIDNSFRNDPEQYKYLKQVLELQTTIKPYLEISEFSDIVGIMSTPAGVTARIFNLKNDNILLLYAAEHPPINGDIIMLKGSYDTVQYAGINEDGEPLVRRYRDETKIMLTDCRVNMLILQKKS